MISTTPSPRASKFEQIKRFLETPAAESLLEPNEGRADDTHRVCAQLQKGGAFILSARKPVPDSDTSVPVGDLDKFLNAVIQEVKDARGDDVADAAVELLRSIARWNHYGQAPTVAELRTRIGRLSALPPSEPQLRSRAAYRVKHFQQALQQQLDALPEKDPKRDALKKAGDQLAYMLFAPNETLSLEGVSPKTIRLLLKTGLLQRFADLRDGVKPAPRRLKLSSDAQALLDRLPSMFPSIHSWFVG